MSLSVCQERITHFYNCVGCLMTAQLQSLALESIDAFTNLLVQPSYSVLPYEHSGLVVRVLLEGSEIKYEPTFSEFEVPTGNCACVYLRTTYYEQRRMPAFRSLGLAFYRFLPCVRDLFDQSKRYLSRDVHRKSASLCQIPRSVHILYGCGMWP